jgi:DNA polymerase-3 subunit epsilon
MSDVSDTSDIENLTSYISMIVSETPFAAIDFESAGIRKGGTDVAVQIGIGRMQGGVLGETFTSYLAADQEITWSAQKVHGIRKEDLAGAPTLTTLWPRLKSLLEGNWIVAHGAATEKRFLRAFPFHGFGPWVDTLKLSRAVWPELPSYALGDLIGTLGLEDELRANHAAFRWHDALSDALASLILLRRIVGETAINGEPAELLLRADDSFHHRLRARRP